MRRLRAAILGCGQIAERHARAILMLREQMELVAVCDHTAAKARAFAEQHGAAAAAIFTDHHALLQEQGLDLIVICLPPFRHADEVELAAARGIHLLIEKPIALTSAQAWQMVAATERAGIKTQVGFMYRFGAAVEQFRSRVAPGTVGLFSARYFCNSLHAPWWRDREKSGGQLVEQVIHLFDLLRYLMGEPESLYSRQVNFFHRQLPDYSVEDVSATVLTFPNGGVAVVYATNGAVPGQWIKEWRIVSPSLVAEFRDWNHATFTATDLSQPVTETIASEQDVFLLQMTDLVTSIRTGGDTRMPLREGARSLDLVLAAVHSAETHTEIRLGSP